MPSLLIGFDFWGAGNCGDDLMLAGFLSWMKNHQSHWKIACLCAHDIQAMRKRFPEITWYSAEESVREAALKNIDLWIGLGGGVFQNDEGDWILNRMDKDLETVKALGIPAYYVGVGLNNREALLTDQAKRIIQRLEHCWVRDEVCYQEIINVGYPRSKISVGADVAHLFCAKMQYPPVSDSLALCLIAPESKINYQSLEETLATFRLPISWLAQEMRDLPGSETTHYQNLSQTDIPLCTLDYGHCTIDEILRHLTSSKIMLSSRYHTTLACAWAGVDVTVYDRNLKLRGIQEELDLPLWDDLVNKNKIREAIMMARPVDSQRLKSCVIRAHSMLNGLFSRVSNIS